MGYSLGWRSSSRPLIGEVSSNNLGIAAVSIVMSFITASTLDVSLTSLANKNGSHTFDFKCLHSELYYSTNWNIVK